MNAENQPAIPAARIDPSGSLIPNWLWSSLKIGASIGGVIGGLFGLQSAVAVHILSGLALDGDPPPSPNLFQIALLYLGLTGGGAGLGTIAVASFVGFVLAICTMLRADRLDKSLSLKLAKLWVALVSLAGVWMIVAAIVKRSVR